MTPDPQIPLPFGLPIHPVTPGEDELASQRWQNRILENGQKIIVGGLAIKAVRLDPGIRQWLIAEADKVTRPGDRKRLAPLLAELAKLAEEEGDR